MIDTGRWQLRERRLVWALPAAFLFARLIGGRMPYLFFYFLTALTLVALIWTWLLNLLQVEISVDGSPVPRGRKAVVMIEVVNPTPLYFHRVRWQDRTRAQLNQRTGGNDKPSTGHFNIGPWGRVTLENSVIPFLPGRYHTGPVQLTGGDAFGFFAQRLNKRTGQSVTVRPCVIPAVDQAATQLQSDINEGQEQKIFKPDYEFDHLRTFQSGDSLKYVHWKVSAKTGTLMTQGRYTGLGSKPVILVVDRRAGVHTQLGNKEHTFGITLDTVHTIGRYALNSHRPLHLITQGWRRPHPIQHRQQLSQWLHQAVLIQPDEPFNNHPLEVLIELKAVASNRSVHIMVVSPDSSSAFVDAVDAVGRRVPLTVFVPQVPPKTAGPRTDLNTPRVRWVPVVEPT